MENLGHTGGLDVGCLFRRQVVVLFLQLPLSSCVVRKACTTTAFSPITVHQHTFTHTPSTACKRHQLHIQTYRHTHIHTHVLYLQHHSVQRHLCLNGKCVPCFILVQGKAVVDLKLHMKSTARNGKCDYSDCNHGVVCYTDTLITDTVNKQHTYLQKL